MGNALMQAIQGLSSQLNNLANTRLSSTEAAKPDTAKAGCANPLATCGGDTVDTGGGSVTQIHEAMMQYQEMAKLSLAVQFQQAAAKSASGGTESETGTGTATATGEAAQATQLSFDFEADMRVEQMVSFQSKTTQVAEGLDGDQKQTYLETSRQVAARFDMSLKVSGQVLVGFANGSQELAQSDATTLDPFMGLMQDALAQSDEVLNQISELLDGFFGKGGNAGNFVKNLLDSIYKQFFGNGQGASANASETGQTQSQNGQSESQSFTMQLEFEFEIEVKFNASVQVKTEGVQQSDPIMFDLDGDGFELTNYRDGAKFDILGNGQKASTAFVTGGDAFLAIDRNGNGTIDSGKELFGDQNGARNGYEELAKLDTNGDGVINAKDKVFDQLKLFRDNGNGVTEDGELISLADAGIKEISLRYRDVSQVIAGGNRLAQVASYRRMDGSLGRAGDAILNFTA